MKDMAALAGMLLAFLAVLQLASADIIDPSQKNVILTNVIVNIDDYPEQAFVSVCKLGEGYTSPLMVTQDGKIGQHYKLCSVDVFAIDRSKILTDAEIDGLLSMTNDSQIRAFLGSKGANLVIRGIEPWLTVPKTSPLEERVNSYEVDMEKIATRPAHVNEKRNWSYIIYTIVPLVALILLIFWIVRKKMNAHVERSS